jgi:hypothetical protein
MFGIDRLACEAVLYHLAHVGAVDSTPARYDCDLGAGQQFNGQSAEYESLARQIVAQIVVEQPFAVFRGLKMKFYDQLQRFGSNLRLSNLALPLISLFACLSVYGVTIGFAPNWQGAFQPILLGLISLACAMITPAIEPSVLAVGTLATFLMSGFLLIFYAVLALLNLPALFARPAKPPTFSPLKRP